MSTISILILINAGLAIFSQIFFPKLRNIIIVGGAVIAVILSTTGPVSVKAFFSLLPWDILAILLALQLFGEILQESNIFEVVTRNLSGLSRGKPLLIIIILTSITYLFNCFTDNYQTLILMIPPVINIVKQLQVSKRFIQILFGLLLVTSNLGGASTPIGDFPALCMLSNHLVTFSGYLTNATPLLVIAFVTCLGTAVMFYLYQPINLSLEQEVMAERITYMLLRRVKVNWKILAPTLITFGGMTCCWIAGLDTVKVSIVGFLVLSFIVRTGQVAETKIVHTKATIFIYYICLFTIIASIEQTGILAIIAQYLLTFKQEPALMLLVFVTVTTMVTGIVSAGPSTIAMMPIVQKISGLYPPNMVITCFILSICAGSSLFLTSATAGPLMTRLSDEHAISVSGHKMVYTFKDYLLPGFVGCFLIYLVNVVQILFKLV